MKAKPQSPLGQLFSAIIARDEADRAIDFARLQAIVSKRETEREAMQHALSCIDACEAQGIEDYDEETLSHNIEGNFPELDLDECDAIASSAIAKATGEK